MLAKRRSQYGIATTTIDVAAGRKDFFPFPTLPSPISSDAKHQQNKLKSPKNADHSIANGPSENREQSRL